MQFPISINFTRKNRFKPTGQSVIHVEAKKFYILHVQRPIHENSEKKKTQNWMKFIYFHELYYVKSVIRMSWPLKWIEWVKVSSFFGILRKSKQNVSFAKKINYSLYFTRCNWSIFFQSGKILLKLNELRSIVLEGKSMLFVSSKTKHDCNFRDKLCRVNFS